MGFLIPHLKEIEIDVYPRRESNPQRLDPKSSVSAIPPPGRKKITTRTYSCHDASAGKIQRSFIRTLELK